MHVDLKHAKAFLRAQNVAVLDFKKLPNALHGGHSTPATTSFDIRWTGSIKRVTERNMKQHYRASFIRDHSTIRWWASKSRFQFVSGTVTQQHFSQIGRERSGRFF